MGKDNDKKKTKQEPPAAAETAKVDGDALVKAFETAFGKAAFGGMEMYFQFLDMFPYQIEVFAPDGTSVYFNRAACEQHNIADPKQVIGHFNLIADPVSNDILGLREHISRMFNGEAYTIYDIRMPFEDTGTRYDKKDENLDATAYMDISAFPLRDANGKIAYIVMIFQTKHTYKGRTEIRKAQEYINNNWLDEYDTDKIARAVNLSPTTLFTLFKQYLNETPHNYYKRVKVGKIKSNLLDPNISIADAFAACGVDYHGDYAQIFKKFTGLTPTEYRKEKFKTRV